MADLHDMDVAKAIEKAMDESGLNQKEFAARCGINLARMHDLLHANVHARAADIFAICDAFYLDANEVLGLRPANGGSAEATVDETLDSAALDYLAVAGPSTSAPLLMRELQKRGYAVKLPDVVRALASMGIRAASETRPKHTTRRRYIDL